MSISPLPDLRTLHKPLPRQNHAPTLPSTHTISRRPIQHAPITSVRAGPNVSKIVYVSRRTPVIVAVKRVKAYLRQIERRALMSMEAKDGGVRKRRFGTAMRVLEAEDGRERQRMEEVSRVLAKEKEEVLVKASGRAMEQAMRVAEWFRSREDEMVCLVEVRAGSVSVVDDVVEREDASEHEGRHGESSAELTLTGGDTTLELLGGVEKDGAQQGQNQMQEMRDGEEIDKKTTSEAQSKASNGLAQEGKLAQAVPGHEDVPATKKRKRKRTKSKYDPDDIPEARIRWVKTVEIAISLKA